jgi:hypothetical protein
MILEKIHGEYMDKLVRLAKLEKALEKSLSQKLKPMGFDMFYATEAEQEAWHRINNPNLTIEEINAINKDVRSFDSLYDDEIGAVKTLYRQNTAGIKPRRLW